MRLRRRKLAAMSLVFGLLHHARRVLIDTTLPPMRNTSR